MSYFEYVCGAYAVFAAFLAWDFLVPRLRLAKARRDIARRAARDAVRDTTRGAARDGSAT